MKNLQLKIKSYLAERLLETVKDVRYTRGAKFMFFSKTLSIKNLLNILAYENFKHHRDADDILIKVTLSDLIERKILHKESVKYSSYKFKRITYHDIYLKTTENKYFCRGTSTDLSEAYAKALGEVFERTSIKFGNEEEIVTKKIGDFKNVLAKPTSKQLEKFPNFHISEDDEFKFVKVKKISDFSDFYVPVQTIFFGGFIFSKKHKEKPILESTTNGAGAGFSLVDAFRSCLFEIVHRHEFFKCWYGKISPCILNLKTIPGNSSVSLKIAEFERKGFKINILDFSDSAKLPTFICIIEKFGAWYCGGSTAYKSLNAIERSIDEAFSEYLWTMQANTEGRNTINQIIIQEIMPDFVDVRANINTKMFLFGNSAFVSGFDKFILTGNTSNYTEEFDLKFADSGSSEEEKLKYLYKYANDRFGENIFLHNQEKNYLQDYDYFVSKLYIPNSYYFPLTDTYSRPILADNKEPVFTQINPFP